MERIQIAIRLLQLITNQTSIQKITHTCILEKVMKTFKKKYTNIEWYKTNFTSMIRARCKMNFSFENVKVALFNDQINPKAL